MGNIYAIYASGTIGITLFTSAISHIKFAHQDIEHALISNETNRGQANHRIIIDFDRLVICNGKNTCNRNYFYSHLVIRRQAEHAIPEAVH